MKALTFQGTGEVRVMDVPKPAIKGAGEALIKVTLGAVCGSDLHILHGNTPMNPGAVLGHEFVGVVEDAGPDVKRFKTGDVVAVVGAGPVGLMATMCAQLFGPARVFVVDMVDARLEIAQELGGIPINAKQMNPVETIRERTGGLGADASIECVGLLSAVDTAIHCVRGGGTISMVGVPSTTIGDFPFMRAWLKSLTFRAGWCNVQAYMRPLLDLIAAGRLKPESIISHRMRLDQAEEAYRMFDAREATKIVLAI